MVTKDSTFNCDIALIIYYLELEWSVNENL